MADDSEYRNKQRSSFWWASLVWCLLIALAYFGADIVDKGHVLNEMTPYPVLGYVLWASLAIALWFLLLQPIVQFCNLRRVGRESLKRQTRRAARVLRAYRHEPEGSELRRLHEEFRAAPRDFRSLEGRNGWEELMARYRMAIRGRAKDTILGYCKAAGVGVVFSRNNLLDGLILLAMQVRLVIALARTYGYKPSPVFNACCLGWIAVNSLIAALTRGAVEDLSETAADTMLELVLGSDELATASTEVLATKAGLQITVQILIEAIMAGTAVYITGRLFLWKLENEGHEVTLKTLLELRAEGRRELAGNLLRKAPAAVMGTAAKVSAGAVKKAGSAIRQWFGGSSEPEATLPPAEDAALPQPEGAPKAENSPSLAGRIRGLFGSKAAKAEESPAAAAEAPALPAVDEAKEPRA